MENEIKNRWEELKSKNLIVCMDCSFHGHDNEEVLTYLELQPDGGTCKHYDPKYWEEKGYKQHWGDAAVGNNPHLNILRRETENDVEYLILSCHTRRPVEIYFNKASGYSWGSY